jgi:nucleotide-binding universal stress UspA family protein
MAALEGMRILLAVDGSSHALDAARLVSDLPLPPGSCVTALGVLTLRNYLYSPGREGLLAALDQAEATLAGCSAEVRTGLRYGHPAEELVSYADEHQVQLMVLGARGLRGTLSILLGGVAQQIVEYAGMPVLIVRSPYTGLRRVLLACDGSRPAEQAACFLGRLPLPAGAEVSVVHVLPPELSPAMLAAARAPVAPVPGALAEKITAVQNEADERNGHVQLDKARLLLHNRGLPAEAVLRRGDAATEILDYARSMSVDLIVAGSRGISGVRSWMLGSVSRKLVHYAHCSVLIVRGTDDKSCQSPI